MKIVSKIALAATFGFALAFTLSCSGDDDKKDGGWLTCEEYRSLAVECKNKYEAEREACREANDEACYDAVNAKNEKCFIDGACNGTSIEECGSHYESMDCKLKGN